MPTLLVQAVPLPAPMHNINSESSPRLPAAMPAIGLEKNHQQLEPPRRHVCVETRSALHLESKMETATLISSLLLTFAGRANLKFLLLDMDAMDASSFEHRRAVHDEDHGEPLLMSKSPGDGSELHGPRRKPVSAQIGRVLRWDADFSKRNAKNMNSFFRTAIPSSERRTLQAEPHKVEHLMPLRGSAAQTGS